jgi:DNA-binding Lrp family transcriptional regulator
MQQVESKSDDQAAREEKPAEAVQVTTGGGKTSQVLVKEQEQYSASDFHDNDTKVLDLLNEAGSNYSFKGIMRKLNIHQQSLSRALHRLEEMGAIERTSQGYKMGSAVEARPPAKPKGVEYTQLLQTYIPVNVKSSELLRHLVGKWFASLRWLGMIDSTTGYTLQWTSEDGSFQINLQLISDYVIIETNASTEKEKVQAMAGSYAIFEHISRAIQNSMAASYRLDRSAFANN